MRFRRGDTNSSERGKEFGALVTKKNEETIGGARISI